MDHLLEIDSVIKSYGDRRILTDISLRCSPGEVVGIMGRNGSGKSTILKILFGALHTDIKFIRIDGEVLQRPFLRRDMVAYLPQDGFLPRNLKVRHVLNLFFGKGTTEGKENAEGEEGMKTTEGTEIREEEFIKRILDARIHELAGGELRYLEIRMILASGARYILLDEPFNGLSPLMVDLVKEHIRSKSKEKGIILTDHDYRNVLDVTDRLYLLYDGAIRVVRCREELVEWGYLPGNHEN